MKERDMRIWINSSIKPLVVSSLNFALATVSRSYSAASNHKTLVRVLFRNAADRLNGINCFYDEMQGFLSSSTERTHGLSNQSSLFKHCLLSHIF